MVHAKSNLIEIGFAVILCDCTPGVTESINAISILSLHAHIFAYLLDAVVYIGTEAVMVAIAIMEREQKLVIFGSEVLVEYRLNEWLLPAFLYMLRQRGNDGSWLSCSL